jgi:hypothetical protein
MPLFNQPTYHERLLKVINAFETLCGSENIRIVATARNELEEWKVLKYNAKDELWKKFGRPYELIHPTPKALVDFLDKTAVQGGLTTKSEDLNAIATSNQGAYRNIVQNLRRLTDEYRIVSKDVFIPTLQGSWHENYEILVEQQPCVKVIYDAIDILMQANIRLYTPIILKLALWLWGGDRIQQIAKRRQLAKGFNFLVNEKKILPYRKGEIIPYDGQIKDRGASTNWEPFYQGLTYLALLFSETYKDALLDSLTGFYALLTDNNRIEQAERIKSRISELTLGLKK